MYAITCGALHGNSEKHRHLTKATAPSREPQILLYSPGQKVDYKLKRSGAQSTNQYNLHRVNIGVVCGLHSMREQRDTH